MEISPHINRPIGLIEATWGGTPVEAWSSPDARNACSQRRKRYHFKFLHKSILSMECMGKRVNFLTFSFKVNLLAWSWVRLINFSAYSFC